MSNIHKSLTVEEFERIFDLDDEIKSAVPSQEWDTVDSFDDIIKRSPDIIRNVCDLFDDSIERKSVFYSFLAGLSSLPNFYTLYDKKQISSNLFLYGYGPFGSGKSAFTYTTELLKPIHEHLLSLPSESLDKSNERLLFIPADLTKASLYQIIKENNGRGIIIDTEGDTITAANKTKFGNFTDILNKGFHHERLSKGIKSEGYIEIENLELSIILTSTPDQLRRFFYNSENGLLSRFIFLELKADYKFKNVFASKSEIFQNTFNETKQILLNSYLYQLNRLDKLTFKFTISQQNKFESNFQLLKEQIMREINEELAGIINRLGIITTRICMIFTFFRNLNIVRDTTEIECSDEDFDNAFTFLNDLIVDTFKVYNTLSNNNSSIIPDTSKQKMKAKELDALGFSCREIAQRITSSKSTVARWLKE